MTAIVKGHGSRPDDQMTFVPSGRAVKFYSGFDVNLSTSLALAAIANGDFTSPHETYGEGEIPNYAVWTQDDGFYAKWYAMGAEASVPIWWVGQDISDGTRLCENPEMCPGLGEHTCLGVLGQVQDADLVILACRGFEGAAPGTTGSEAHLGSDPDDPLYDLGADLGQWVTDFVALAASDLAAAEAQADALPQATLALLVNYHAFNSWQVARAAASYAGTGDVSGFVNQLRTNPGQLDWIFRWLDEAGSYGQAVDTFVADKAEELFPEIAGMAPILDPLRQRAACDREYVRWSFVTQARAYLASAGEAAFLDWYRTLPQDQRDLILTDPQLAAIPGATGEQNVAAAPAWVPQDPDLATAAEVNGQAIKELDDDESTHFAVGGFLLLIGDGHGDGFVQYVDGQADKATGTVSVRKGGIGRGSGRLTFTGVPPAKQAIVEEAVARFSDKTVRFA